MQAVFDKLDAIDARIPEEIKAQVKTLQKEFREHQEECEQLLQNVTKQAVPVPKKRKAANSKQQGSTSASGNSNKSEGKRWRCGKTKQTKPKKSQGGYRELCTGLTLHNMSTYGLKNCYYFPI